MMGTKCCQYKCEDKNKPHPSTQNYEEYFKEHDIRTEADEFTINNWARSMKKKFKNIWNN